MVEAGIVLEELGPALHPGPWQSTAVAATRALTASGDTDETGALLAGSPTAPPWRRWPSSGARPAAVERRPEAPCSRELSDVADAAAADASPDRRDRDGQSLRRRHVVRRRRRTPPDRSTDQEALPGLDSMGCPPAGWAPRFRRPRGILDDVLDRWAADALGAAQAVLELTSTTPRCATSSASRSAPSRRSSTCAPTCTKPSSSPAVASSTRCGPLTPPTLVVTTSPQCAPKRSPDESPRSAIPPSRSSAASDTPGSTTPTSTSGAS